MQATIRENFYCIDASVESLVRTCNTCQKCKITAVKKSGKIALPVSTTVSPWEEVKNDVSGVTVESVPTALAGACSNHASSTIRCKISK